MDPFTVYQAGRFECACDVERGQIVWDILTTTENPSQNSHRIYLRNLLKTQFGSLEGLPAKHMQG